jgi:hypothetical protein
MKKTAKIGSYAAIGAGIFGLLHSVAYLYTNNMVSVVGAGFAFVGAAIIASGGLLTLAYLSKYEKQNSESI